MVLTVIIIFRPAVAILAIFILCDVLQVVHCGSSPCCHGSISTGTCSGGDMKVSVCIALTLFCAKLSERYWSEPNLSLLERASLHLLSHCHHNNDSALRWAIVQPFQNFMKSPLWKRMSALQFFFYIILDKHTHVESSVEKKETKTERDTMSDLEVKMSGRRQRSFQTSQFTDTMTGCHHWSHPKASVPVV